MPPKTASSHDTAWNTAAFCIKYNRIVFLVANGGTVILGTYKCFLYQKMPSIFVIACELWSKICPQSPLHELIRYQHNGECICQFPWQSVHTFFQGPLYIHIFMDLGIIFITHVHCMSFEEILIHYIGVHNIFNVQTGPCGLHFKMICYKFIAISHPVVSLLSCLRQDWISRFWGIFLTYK